MSRAAAIAAKCRTEEKIAHAGKSYTQKASRKLTGALLVGSPSENGEIGLSSDGRLYNQSIAEVLLKPSM